MKKEADKVKVNQIREDYKTVLGTAAGKRLLWHIIIDVCGVKKTATDVSNVYSTYFEGGKRKIGNAIIQKIDEIDPMFMFKMARENTKNK